MYSFILMIIIPCILAFTLIFQSLENSLREKALQSIQANNLLMCKNTDEFFARAINSIASIAKSKAFNTFSEFDNSTSSIDKYEHITAINDFTTYNAPVIAKLLGSDVNIAILNNEGTIKYYNYNYNQFNNTLISNITNSTLPQLQNNGIYWGGCSPLFFEKTQKNCFYLILKPFQTENTLPSGIAFLGIPETSISDFFTSKALHHAYYLVDENDTIISSNKKDMINTDAHRFSWYTDKVTHNTSQVWSQSHGKNGNISVFAFDTLTSNGWKLIESEDLDPVFTTLFNPIRDVILTILLILSIYLIIAYFISRQVSRPLQKLTSIMNDTSYYLNEYDSTESGTHTDNEVALLNTSMLTMKNNIIQLINDNKKNEEMTRRAEISALQAQIRPHFLFNTLNSIRWMCENGENEKAANIVVSLNKLLRMTIDNDNKFIPLKEELENLDNFIRIIKMRHSIKFEVAYDVDDDVFDYLLPKLLLQPLVENSIYHGFENKDGDNFIILSAYKNKKKQRMEIIIDDNGKGMTQADMEKRKSGKNGFNGIGIHNVNDRIKLNYGESYHLELVPKKGNGTKFLLILPIDGINSHKYTEESKG